jgi:hypothetical protein
MYYAFSKKKEKKNAINASCACSMVPNANKCIGYHIFQTTGRYFFFSDKLDAAYTTNAAYLLFYEV